MDRKSNLDILYTSPPMDVNLATFESIPTPCYILQVLTPQDINQLNYIAKSKKLSSQPTVKLKMIKDIMEARGFKRLAGGTNRIAYKYMEDQRFIIKVAYDHVGLSDNLCELYNQHILKPFCTKVFEVSPCGTVGLFERVTPVTNREQFYNISEDVFDIIVNRFLGKYILADFGTKFFLNWGVRKNAHPVILDFPYVYELDGAKLYCNRPDITTESGFCGGEIDYDDGFNNLRCTKCGKTFMASELRLALENKNSDIIISQEDMNMIVNVYRGDELIQSVDTTKETSTYKTNKFGRKKETPLEYRIRKRQKNFSVIIESEIVEVNGKEEKSHYVEQTTPKQEEVKDTYRPSDFNQRVTLASVTTDIDDLYKNLNVQTFTRSGKMYENGVDSDSKKEETTRVEDTLDIVSRATKIARDIVIDSDDTEDEPEEKYTPAEVVEEDTAEDSQEEHSVESEGVDQSEDYEDDSSEERSEDNIPFEIQTELRGKDASKNKFDNDDQSVDSAFFD